MTAVGSASPTGLIPDILFVLFSLEKAGGKEKYRKERTRRFIPSS